VELTQQSLTASHGLVNRQVRPDDTVGQAGFVDLASLGCLEVLDTN